MDLTQQGDPAAILFDKDGTLFDFGATWNGFAVAVIQELADGDLGLAAALAEAARFDMGESRFRPDSPMIAGTNREAAELLAAVLPGGLVDAVEIRLTELAATARVVEAVPLGPFLAGLSARGLALGVMTNDSETAARAHLAAAGVDEAFDFIAGFDSGHGAKPSPEPLLAFCAAVGVDPHRAVMVGDSTHDLIAGRAAGMRTVGVLTGLAPEAVLAPHADVVFPHIGHLSDWLPS